MANLSIVKVVLDILEGQKRQRCIFQRYKQQEKQHKEAEAAQKNKTVQAETVKKTANNRKSTNNKQHKQQQVVQTATTQQHKQQNKQYTHFGRSEKGKDWLFNGRPESTRSSSNKTQQQQKQRHKQQQKAAAKATRTRKTLHNK